MCLICICLSEKKEITANLPLWIMKRIKSKHVKCLVGSEKKRKITEHLYKKSLNIRKVEICEMHSTFFFSLLFSHLLCFYIYILCKYITHAVVLAEELGRGISWANTELTLIAGIPRPWAETRQIWLRAELQVPSAAPPPEEPLCSFITDYKCLYGFNKNGNYILSVFPSLYCGFDILWNILLWTLCLFS